MKTKLLFISLIIFLGSACVKDPDLEIEVFSSCFLQDLKTLQDIDNAYDEERADYFENKIDSDPDGCKLIAMHEYYSNLYWNLQVSISSEIRCEMSAAEKKMLINRIEDNREDINFQITQLEGETNCKD